MAMRATCVIVELRIHGITKLELLYGLDDDDGGDGDDGDGDDDYGDDSGSY
jgi:hypothetical protein